MSWRLLSFLLGLPAGAFDDDPRVRAAKDAFLEARARARADQQCSPERQLTQRDLGQARADVRVADGDAYMLDEESLAFKEEDLDETMDDNWPPPPAAAAEATGEEGVASNATPEEVEAAKSKYKRHLLDTINTLARKKIRTLQSQSPSRAGGIVLRPAKAARTSSE